MILPLIKDTDWKVRSVVAGILGSTGEQKGIPALLLALKDLDWQVRLASLESLRKLGSEDVYEKIIVSTKDPVWIVRRSAVEILGDRRIPDSGDTLKITMKDESAEVRIASCFAVGKLAESQFIPLLKESLSDKEPPVRAAAAEALGNFDCRENPAIIQLLIALLKDSSYAVKNSSLITLGKFREKSAVNPTMDLMKKDEGKLRLQAVKTLGEIGINRPIPLLLQLLRDDPLIASDIIRALGNIGDTMPLFDLVDFIPKQTDKKLIDLIYETIDILINGNSEKTEGKRNLVCLNCYHRFKEINLSIPGRNPVKFTACRDCRGSEFIEGITEINAVLHREMNADYLIQDPTFNVNWLQAKHLFDFDKLKILHADDFDVEGFVMAIRNDTDEERKKRMKSIPVHISKDADLSRNKINLLEMTFGKIKR